MAASLAEPLLAAEDRDSENDVAMKDRSAVKQQLQQIQQRKRAGKRRFGVELDANILSLRGRSEESEPAMKKRRMQGHPVKPHKLAAQGSQEGESSQREPMEEDQENRRPNREPEPGAEGSVDLPLKEGADVDVDVDQEGEEDPDDEMREQCEQEGDDETSNASNASSQSSSALNSQQARPQVQPLPPQQRAQPRTRMEQWLLETAQQPSVRRWDRADAGNEACVVEYVDDILRNLRRQEACIAPLGDYMTRQENITAKMRTVLLDWMVDVHRKFGMSPSTQHLAVNILDRYLSLKQVHRRRLQLIGCGALWIASKYHEIYAPEVDDFVYISDNAFSRQDLINAEAQIAQALGFRFTVPTPLSFVERFVKFCTFNLHRAEEQRIIAHLIHYCLEHCMLDYETATQHKPSLVAAAAVCYAVCATRLIAEKRQWQRVFVERLGVPHGFDACLPLMRRLDAICKRHGDACRHKAVRKKYRGAGFSKVALMSFKKLNLDAFQ